MKNEYLYKSTCGYLKIEYDLSYIYRVSFIDALDTKIENNKGDLPKCLIDTIAWLNLYFNGQILDFLPNIYLNVSPFKKRIYNILLDIPYGKTVSYYDVGEELKKRYNYKNISLQAVGHAIGLNPIAIIIPCHRVINKNGDIGKYHYGSAIKKFLLELEKNNNKESL